MRERERERNREAHEGDTQTGGAETARPRRARTRADRTKAVGWRRAHEQRLARRRGGLRGKVTPSPSELLSKTSSTHWVNLPMCLSVVWESRAAVGGGQRHGTEGRRSAHAMCQAVRLPRFQTMARAPKYPPGAGGSTAGAPSSRDANIVRRRAGTGSGLEVGGNTRRHADPPARCSTGRRG